MNGYRSALVLCVVCSACLSFLSGYQASSDLGTIAGDVERELGKHHALGRFYLMSALFLGTFFVVGRKARYGKHVLLALYYAALIAVVSLTVWTGRLGGDLVFEHGVGVKTKVTNPS